jgi:predicted NUDIX family phosphoesterase
MTNKMDEQIIVVPRVALFGYENLLFEGTETRKEIVEELNKNINTSFGVMRRGDAEENENFKQPIPYAVIRRGKEVFMYKRLSGGGEERLHDKLSIGAGGHMNLDGNSFETSLMSNLMRELEEELEIFNPMTKDKKADIKLNVLGFINDESTAVNRVHIGILVVVDIDKDSVVEVRETDQLEGEFVTVDKLKSKSVYSKLEDWSKIAVDSLFS